MHTTALSLLIATRKRLSKQKNWTTGTLYRYSQDADDNVCACAMGGVIVEAGGTIVSGGSVCEKGNGITTLKLGGQHITEQASAKKLKKSFIKAIVKRASELPGFSGPAAVRALAYLGAGARDVGGTDVVDVNDRGCSEGPDLSLAETHALVVRMFDRAIARCKRRHLNG